jgi:NAD(P)-dependent dehydrogenase (short-subunit alcohol dehydrogenase family)
MGKLDGKSAIVTGAAQGIGATYAKALAAEGASVCVSDVSDPKPVVDAINAAGGRAIGVIADVADPKSVAALAAETAKAFGGIHILINNAAIFGKLALKPFSDITSAEWDDVMRVNVRGVFECTKAVAPYMRKQRYGKVVTIASGTVFKGSPMMLHYVTSKGAVVAMTRSLARELGDDGICVNCLAPGLVMSENVKANPVWSGAVVTSNVASRALKRDATPNDMVGTMIFLCSPDSDFMTGQTVVVDGGSVMR